MGYNPLNVSTGKGNTKKGPIQWSPEVILTKLNLKSDLTALGFRRLGEGSTDGVESTQEATVNSKDVWGAKSLGNTFSEFKDTLVANLASSFDTDVLGAVFGTENVVVSADEVLTIVGKRTPPYGTFVFQMTLDDGRDHWIVIPSGQADPNLTRTFNDADIVVTTTTLTASEVTITDTTGDEDAEYTLTHYELTEPIAATLPIS